MCRATNEFREDHSVSYSMTFQVLQSSRFCTSYPDPCVIRELQENVQSDPMLSTPSSTGESMTRIYANHCSSIYAHSDQCFSDPIVLGSTPAPWLCSSRSWNCCKCGGSSEYNASMHSVWVSVRASGPDVVEIQARASRRLKS